MTTFSSGDMVTLGGGAVARLACSSAESTRPVITAAEPMTALRIMKVRRSTPGGACRRDERLFPEGSFSAGLSTFM